MPNAIKTDPGGKEVFATAPTGASQYAEVKGISAIAGASYAALADFGGKLNDFAEKALKPEMASRGAQAVTRDPTTGELTVELRTPLNSLDEAYNHAAHAAFASQSEGDTRLALQKMAQEHLDDPEKFRLLATQYVKTLAGGKGVPSELRGDILNTGLQNVEQFTGNLVSQKQTRDTRNQLVEVKSNIESGWNDVYALAHQGGTNTPDFTAALAKTQNLYGTLQNPVFGMSKATIQNEINEKVSAAYGEAALGQGLAQAKEHGVQAGLDFIDKAVWSPKLNLSPAQRESFAARGKREIGEWDALQRDASTELKQQVDNRLDDALSKAQATGKWQDVISPDEIARAYAKNPAKGADIINRLNSGAEIYSMRTRVLKATPADLAAMDAQLNPANNPQPKGGYDAFYSSFLAPHEGGFTASDGNGSPANFGINQGANPDIDVKALTPETAKQVLHDRYWLASGADQLPADLAAVHGDTAVNMGVGTAKDMLAKSGGDPAKYLTLREAHYREIAGANPEKANNLPTWLARNEDLRNFVRGGGFSDQARVYGSFQQAVQERSKALTKDPAGYAVMARPDVAAMLQSQDPGTIQNGVRSSLMVQRDMGVNAPKVLPAGTTAAIVQSFNNPEDPTKRADHMVGIIASMEQRYGKYFPQAMAELQKAGMPTEAIALAQVKNDPAVAARMSNAVNAGRATLRKVTPATDEIDKAVVSSLGAFNKTLAGQSGNSRVAAQQAEAAQLYAYQLAQEGVANPGQRAVQDIIGKNFAFNDTYRVPTGIDPDLVESGARTLLSELPAGSIMAEHLHDPKITADTRQAMSSSILKSRGVWLTLPDDSGLYLAYPQETGFVPGRLANGKTISFPWAALTGAADRGARAALARTPYVQ